MLFECESEMRIFGTCLSHHVEVFVFLYDDDDDYDERNAIPEERNSIHQKGMWNIWCCSTIRCHAVSNELCCVSLSFIKHSSGYDTFIIYY